MDFSFLAIPIFQRALLAGSVLAALLALLGVLVTARGLAYLGDGLSHAAFGGIALGMFVGLSSPLVPSRSRSRRSRRWRSAASGGVGG